MIGIGTLTNVLAIVIGAVIGVALGSRFPERTNRVVIDGAGIAVLVLGGINMMSLFDSSYVAAVTGAGTFLVVVVSVVIGGATGSLLRIEDRIAGFGSFLHDRFARGSNDNAKRATFINGFVSSSLIFAVGPMGIRGSVSDGMGTGADTLFLKPLPASHKRAKNIPSPVQTAAKQRKHPETNYEVPRECARQMF